MSKTALSVRAEHECGGDYCGLSGAVGVSIAEMEAIQLVMMCEGAGWDGLTCGEMGTTLQSENRYSSTWEHSTAYVLWGPVAVAG